MNKFGIFSLSNERTIVNRLIAEFDDKNKRNRLIKHCAKNIFSKMIER